jgi:hypothetical protein
MVAEARSPEVLFSQLLRLDGGAHGAVEDQDSPGQKFT